MLGILLLYRQPFVFTPLQWLLYFSVFIFLVCFVTYRYLDWEKKSLKGRINKKRGRWFALSQASSFLGHLLFGIPLRVPEHISLGNWSITITTYPYNKHLDSDLPWTGTIVKLLDIIYDDHYYLAKLDKPHLYKDYVPNYILLTKMKDYGEVEADHIYIMQVFLIPFDTFINEDVKTEKGLCGLGYVTMTNNQPPTD